MDIGLFRGLITVILLALFVGLCVLTFSGKRDADFREAERLPLDDDDPAGGRSNKEQYS